MNRKEFIKQSSLVGLSALILPNSVFSGTLFTGEVRIGLIGVGLRGQSHLDTLLRRSDVKVVAMADPNDRMIGMALDLFEQHQKPKPRVYQKGDYDYQNLLAQKDIDAVIIATPWEWHHQQATQAMRAGKITGLEVCGAMNLEECWDYVKVYEKTKVPIFMMENVCYRRDIMAVMNMVRKGKFGQIVHGEGGYQHDLRPVLFNDGEHPYGHGVKFGEGAFSEAQWRTLHHIRRNADLYPTHGLGPIATMVNVNRGNRILYLTSMSNQPVGLQDYLTKTAESTLTQVSFKQGDYVQTMLKCENGETILLSLNTTLQRPYNLGFKVHGTDGIWQEYGSGSFTQGHLYFEEEMDHRDQWENSAAYLSKYDHPYWKEHEQKATGAGHGGMDYFLLNDFVKCIKTNTEFPFDVYDLATWYAVTPLSEQSLKSGSTPQKMPDFTSGKYKERKPVFGFENYSM